MQTIEYPLFPLSTVVFPGGVMPMRIFEPRYLEMVSYCMKNEIGFVICAAKRSDDGFSAPRSMGTRVEIVDFDRLDDGQLGITARGCERVAIRAPYQSQNGQWWGSVEPVAEGEDGRCPAECAVLKQIVAALIRETGLPYEPSPSDYDSANWLSARLTELLPFDPATKHALLAIDDPQERLRRIRPMIEIGETHE